MLPRVFRVSLGARVLARTVQPRAVPVFPRRWASDKPNHPEKPRGSDPGKASTGASDASTSSDASDASASDAHRNSSKEVGARNSLDVADSVKPSTSPAAPAQTDNTGIEFLMKKDTKPYIPKAQHQRVSYEYPGLPNEDNFGKAAPKRVNRWTRYLPKILTVIVVGWGAYMVKIWWFPSEEEENANDMLDPHKFHTFIVTHKMQIDADHYLIELVPKNKHWQYLYYVNYDDKSIWNGDKVWLVEVVQPDISVVRSYTPLPLYFMKSEHTRLGEREPLLRTVNNDGDDYDKGGSMCLYVKRYDDGEVLRYLTLKTVGDEIQLRGPHIEYRMPYHPVKLVQRQRPIFRDLPLTVEADNGVENLYKTHNLPPFDNMVVYAAGTGIAPILQVLFSRNPYRGYVTIHYSARKPGELGPMARFLFFLEKLDRVKVVYHYDSEHSELGRGRRNRDFAKPEPPNYLSSKRVEEAGDDAAAALKLRMEIMNQEGTKKEMAETPAERGTYYNNGLEQAAYTMQQRKQPPALALVCGPDGYVDYVAGKKNLVTGEQGPVTGKLGEAGWDNTNTFKLE